MGIFGGNNDDLEIKVTLDDSEAVNAAARLDNSLQRLEQTAGKAAGKGFSSFQASVVTFAQGLQAAQQVVNLVTGTISTLGGAVLDLAQKGDRLGSLQEGFAALGGQTKTITEARERVLGLVSATDLYALANKAMVSGLPDVNKNFGDIADLGARLANTLGKDTKESIEALTQAIATGRSVQLQQLGIFVDSKKAVEEWARANGRSVESLNELEKKQAVQKASIDAVKTSLETTAKVTDSAANATDSLSNTYDDLLGEVGKLINENPTLAEGFRQIEEKLKEIDAKQLASDIGELAGALAGMAANAIPDVNSKVTAFRIGLSTLFDIIENNPLTRLSEDIKQLAQSLGSLQLTNFGEAILAPFKALSEIQLSPFGQSVIDALGGAGQAIKAVTISTSPLIGAFSELAEKSTPKVVDGLKEMIPTVDELSVAFKKGAVSTVPLVGAYNSLLDVLSEDFTRAGHAAVIEVIGLDTNSKKLTETISGGSNNLRNALDEAAKGLGAVTDKSKELVDIQKLITERVFSAGFKRQVDGLSEAYRNQVLDSDQLTQALEDLRKAWIAGGGAAEKFNDIVGAINLDKVAEDIKKTGGLADLLTEALFGDDKSGEGTRAAVAGAFGDIGGILQDELLKAFGLDDQGSGIGAALGQAAGTAIGAALTGGSAAGAEAGSTIGKLLGSITDGIFSGKGDAQTKVRRNIGGYIEDIIKEVNFQIINAQGKVVPFTELILGDRGRFSPGSEFNDFIENAPAQLTNAFIGVGGAIGQNFAGEFAQGAQVGSILFEQFGGSIDNLKLLVLELGLSFEDAQTAMVDAFLAGDQSALEVVSRLRDMEEAFKPGLEGFGQFEKAFENFIASAGQGRVSLKSLRDGAVEFKETGSNSLAAYRQALESSGKFTAEQIEQLFSGLATRGINSLDELANASDLTLIGVIADLEAMGFAFAEGIGQGVQEAQDEIIALRDSLNEIPDEVTKRVTLRVRSVFEDKGAEAALDAATGGQGIARA